MEYLKRARVERGKQLLESGEASVCEIASSLGFCDQSHFTRTFRQFAGVTPSVAPVQTATSSVSDTPSCRK